MNDQCNESFIDKRVRIALRRNFKEMPVDIMRGIVTDTNSVGISISGRHFQEVMDTASGEYDQRPLSKLNKIFFIPFSSVKYLEVIIKGTKAADLADKIEKNTVLETPIKEFTYSPKSNKTRNADI
ncbi:hypothetical protein KAH27_08835 [bacterium]|nr:hypothetical protein [bacterium]